MPALSSQPHRPAAKAAPDNGPIASLQERWDTLQRKAQEIAALADLGAESGDPQRQNFGQSFSDADERASEIAARGIEDMELLAETGLKALRQVQARGKPVQAPALALWRELYHAREAVLLVLQPVPA